MSTPLQIGPLISEIIEKIYDDRLTSSDLKSDEKNPTNTILTWQQMKVIWNQIIWFI